MLFPNLASINATLNQTILRGFDLDCHDQNITEICETF